jgi:hypothetical protein
VKGSTVNHHLDHQGDEYWGQYAPWRPQCGRWPNQSCQKSEVYVMETCKAAHPRRRR